eukprot:COSAG02_NODE_2066_length_9960_cov_3.087009_6_plen_97_part_00
MWRTPHVWGVGCLSKRVGTLVLVAGLESVAICARDARLSGRCSLCAADKKAVRQNEWVLMVLNQENATFATINCNTRARLHALRCLPKLPQHRLEA